MHDQAVNEYLAADGRRGMRDEEISALRQSYASTGWRGYWKKRLELTQAAAKRTTVQAIEMARRYVRLGEKD
jgi:hypothetical protein